MTNGNGTLMSVAEFRAERLSWSTSALAQGAWAVSHLTDLQKETPMRTVALGAAMCLLRFVGPLVAQDTTIQRRPAIPVVGRPGAVVRPSVRSPDLQGALRAALGLQQDSRVTVWQRTSGLKALQTAAVIPYLIFIEAVVPDRPAPNQEIRVRFHLSNIKGSPIAGVVRADVDGQRMIATAAATIASLKPGEDATGEFWTYGRGAGVHVAHVEFTNGAGSGDNAGYNPYDPSTFQLGGPGHPAFKAEDSQEFVVGTPDPILSSSDLPSGGPPTSTTCGDPTATFGPSTKVLREWAPVASEATATPAVGTVVARHVSRADFPFAHPFGWDFDFYLVPDAQWMSLLAPANAPTVSACRGGKADQDFCEATDSAARRGIGRVGILGIETDSLLIAPPYRPLPGDRTVVYGTWIVDCGHPDRHTEIHPPLLVAAARVQGGSGELMATFLGQAYRTKQTYLGDNAPFLPHALGQIARAGFRPGLTQIQAIPNIEPTAFTGVVVTRYRLAIPATPVFSTESSVRYHFVTRPGVTVSVQHPDKYHVDVVVMLDAGRYRPPSPPKCTARTYHLEDVDRAAGWSLGTLRGSLVAVPAAAPLADFLGSLIGIPPGTLEPLVGKVDVSVQAGILQRTCIVAAPPSPSLAASDNTIDINSNQPYPVVGWIIMDWTRDRVAQLSLAGLSYHRAVQVQRRAAAVVPHP